MSTAHARVARSARAGRRTSSVRLIVDGPAPGAWNMAMDEALLLGARQGILTLRFYRWSPGCLSFGRHQAAAGHYDSILAARMGIDVVRRPTGGRAVYHDREITYAVTAPVETWGGLRQSYGRINRALAAGLWELGAGASVTDHRPLKPAPRPVARACFHDPLPGEVVGEGRKLVGSAQWRDGTVLLQHGSILLHDDQWVAERLRLGPPAGEVARAAVGLAELLGRESSDAEVCEALANAFAVEFGAAFEADEATAEERREACRLEGRYRSSAWTWRR